MLNNISKQLLLVVVAFFGGMIVASCLHKLRDNELVYSYEAGNCGNRSCADMMFNSNNQNAIKTNKVRQTTLSTIDCLTSNENPDSVIWCYRKDGQLLLTYDGRLTDLSVFYNSKNGLLSVSDTDSDGEFDTVVYNSVDDDGNLLRYVKDIGLNGEVEILEIRDREKDNIDTKAPEGLSFLEFKK